MGTSAIVAVSVSAAVYVAVATVVLKPRLDRMAARREQIGDVDVPPRMVYRTIAIVVIGAALGLGVVVAGAYGDAAFISGMAIVGVALGGALALLVRDGERIQRRHSNQGAARSRES